MEKGKVGSRTASQAMKDRIKVSLGRAIVIAGVY